MASLKSPVSCISNAFSFYGVFCFYNHCCQKNQIRLTTSLMNLDPNPGPLVRTIFALFFDVLKSTLLVFWDLTFLYQYESSPLLAFLLLNFLHQQESILKVVNSLKYLGR